MIYDRFNAQINYRTPNYYSKASATTPLAAIRELLPLLTVIEASVLINYCNNIIRAERKAAKQKVKKNEK